MGLNPRLRRPSMGFKCRRPSTLVKILSKMSTLAQEDRSLIKKNSPVFNELPQCRSKFAFGRRSACLLTCKEARRSENLERLAIGAGVKTWLNLAQDARNRRVSSNDGGLAPAV